MKYTIITFLCFGLLLASTNGFSDDSIQPRFVIGLKATIPVTVSSSTNNDLSFTGYQNGDGGVGIGVGVFLELGLHRYFVIETGFDVRTFQLASRSISYSEIVHIPLIAKFRYPVSQRFTFFIGGGIAYFKQTSGSVDPDGSAPGQAAVNLPDTDLRDGFSFIAKFDLRWRLSQSSGFFLNIETGYERAVRSLDITSNDLFFSLGAGFNIF